MGLELGFGLRIEIRSRVSSLDQYQNRELDLKCRLESESRVMF